MIALDLAYLDCDHCGGVAIESEDGMFGEDDGERCITCGIRGGVIVDDSGYDATAYWSSSDDPSDKCNEEDCESCRPTP